MIHYHGTPITPRAQLLRMSGRNFCVSYAAPNDLKTCLSIGQSVMLDNGAFSVFTRGMTFDEDGFYRWVEPVLSHPHWAVMPDVIDGDEEQQRAMLKRWPFRKEFGVPVWHLGLSLDHLSYLIDTYGRVCLGSSGRFWKINSPAWVARMNEAFNYMQKTFGAIPWVHGLRMLGQCDGPWPLASADSTNVAQNHHLHGCAECMANVIDGKQPRAKWVTTEVQQELWGKDAAVA